MLNALEAGGVDNWDNYDDSLAEFRAEYEMEEKRGELLDGLCDILSQGVDQPAGSGCGYSFTEDVLEEAMKLLNTAKVTINAY